MKKLSIIFLITLSVLITSCFKKEEKVPVVETHKKEINNTVLPAETSTWATEKQEIWTWTWKEVSNSWVTKKSEIVKIEESKTNITNTWSENNIGIWTWETNNNSWITLDLTEEDKSKIKLINATISDEIEELSKEEKEFMKNEVDEVDLDTFVKFKNSIYFKDKNNIYFLIYWLNKLTWVNPINFKVLQPDWYYWTNWNWIYILDKKIDNIDFDTLKFAVINESFTVWWDKNNLYIWSRWVFWSGDINSLVYLSENCIKDNKNVYCSFAEFWETKWWDSYYIIEWVETATFEILDYSYSKDKNNIYYEWIKLEWVDSKSFKVFKNSWFAKDENNAYYEWLNLNWIQDIKSFTAINWIPQDENCFYKIDNIENTATCDEE